MGAATVTNPAHGYTVTGDTGAVQVIPAGKHIWVKSFTFVPNAANDTVTITDDNGRTVHKMIAATAQEVHEYFGKPGKKFKGMNVTLSAGNAILFICLD